MLAPTSPIRRTPCVRRNPTAPATSCQIAVRVLRALGAPGVAARAIPAEVERQRPIPQLAELIGEVEPGGLVGGLHVRQDHAGGRGVRPEQPAGELHPVDRREHHGLGVRERLLPDLRALLARRKDEEGKRHHGGDRGTEPQACRFAHR